VRTLDGRVFSPPVDLSSNALICRWSVTSAYARRVDPESVWPSGDAAVATWIAEALDAHGQLSEVGSVVPDGYEAYVEVPLEDEDTFWAVCDVLARHTHADQLTWLGLWEGWPVPSAWRDAPMFRTPEGDLMLFSGRFADIEVIAVEFACAQYALSTVQVDRGPVGTAARMRAQRDHYVPSLWWPEDRAWVLAREVDADAIYLACSAALASRFVGSRGLDARLVSATDATRVEA